MIDLFENLFDDINANIQEPQQILSFWCNPFSVGALKNFTESSFRSQKLPIILEGSRGTGKTTILKYFSVPLQKERAKTKKDKSLLNLIRSERSVGFYFRCDISFVNSFKLIFKNKPEDKWLAIFKNYFELFLSKQIVSLLIDLNEASEIDYLSYESKVINEIRTNSDIVLPDNVSSFRNLLYFITEEQNLLDLYKNNQIFENASYSPNIMLDLFSLSSKLITETRKHEKKLENISFLLLIDEFENLTNELQQLFNTIIKFSNNIFSLRIGRRSEGLVTKATINADEYLKVNHDYLFISIDQTNNINETKNFFYNIAHKRLSPINAKFCHLDIKHLLGDMEDLDEECLSLCKGKSDHFKQVLCERTEISINPDLLERVGKIISNPDNPIMETINALWVIRSKNDVISSAENARNAMLAFISKTDHQSVKKYKNDYSNKYRYAITVLLSAIYRKDKLYYGFNTICHLSNSNPRTFINICRSIISDALFHEKKNLAEKLSISKQSQSRAIHDFAATEFRSIQSIVKHGSKISNVVQNIGNIFSEFHKDKLVRYPETNQFYFNILELPEDIQTIINVAESWSIIFRKNEKQRLSVETAKNGDIYCINPSLAPYFNISYRTRGGKNISLSSHELTDMTYGIVTSSKLEKPKARKSSTKDNSFEEKQITLFELEPSDE